MFLSPLKSLSFTFRFTFCSPSLLQSYIIHLVQTIEAPLPAADVAELPIEFVATIFAITDDPLVNEKGADLRTDIGIEH